MMRILIPVQLLLCAALLGTCERHDMHDLAIIGLPPNRAIYLYYISGVKSGSLGGRNGADTLCYTEGIVYHKFLKADTVKAFLSVSQTDEVRFLVPKEFWYYPVVGINSSLAAALISDSWLGLWSGSIKTDLAAALGIPAAVPPYWWSGSNADGSLAAGATCGGWNQSDNTTMGQAGDQNSVAMSWIGTPTPAQTCNSSQFVLCLAY
jgi:hypothetical protein